MVSISNSPKYHRAAWSWYSVEEAILYLQSRKQVSYSEIYLRTLCKLLGQFVVEASVLSEDRTIASQIVQLLDYCSMTGSINRALDGTYSWKRMASSESKHKGCCYKQTRQAVGTRSSYLADSWCCIVNTAPRLDSPVPSDRQFGDEKLRRVWSPPSIYQREISKTWIRTEFLDLTRYHLIRHDNNIRYQERALLCLHLTVSSCKGQNAPSL